METTFRFKASDLNEQFIIALKTLFKDQEIEISVSEFTDETEKLLNQPENKAFLKKAIEELNGASLESREMVVNEAKPRKTN